MSRVRPAGENQRRSWVRTPWGQLYRARMRAGLEYCRVCFVSDHPDRPLTMDHIVPTSAGGRSGRGNLTILCPGCNQEKRDAVWDLRSLAEEELAADPRHRWTDLLLRDIRTRRYPCDDCGQAVPSTGRGRLVPHEDFGGVRCLGSRGPVEDGSIPAILALGQESPMAR